jgi:spermidine/putrescine transport system ATP-binding protein
VERETVTERGSVVLAGITKRFGDTVAVRSLELSVRPGEFLSLLGPSGCGKTTTLRMLSGFEQPDEGEIHISGKAVARVPAHRRDVNTVFQAYALFPHMSVAENVAYGLRQRRTQRAEIGRLVGEALEMVQMSALSARRPSQLSGGQQQRVALARALVNRPSVLLLDEPLGALDRKLREEMQIELKLLQGRLGTTFVLVTHDQDEALFMSDRVAVMHDGRIEQLGTPRAVYEEPRTAFVAGFVGQQNVFEGTVRDGGRCFDSAGLYLRTTRAATAEGPGIACVRPEVVGVARSAPSLPADGVNSVEGVLVGLAHLGDSVQLVVRVAGRREVVARFPRGHAPVIDVGSAVTCRWSEPDVHLFPSPQPTFSRPTKGTDHD